MMAQWSLIISGTCDTFNNGEPTGQIESFDIPFVFDSVEDCLKFVKLYEKNCALTCKHLIEQI